MPAAVAWLEDAHARCRRWPDTYQWVHGYVLDAACQVTVSVGAPTAPRWVEQLSEVAARGGMRELVIRAHVHRARLGQAGAAEAAALAAADIDNPVLAELVAGL